MAWALNSATIEGLAGNQQGSPKNPRIVLCDGPWIAILKIKIDN
jgi:hypothetical protein